MSTVDITMPETLPVCQYCGATDTYKNGYSPFCTETRFTCRECNEDTWQ